MNDYNFGNLLYELRTEKGLSQSELGEMFGVSNKAVSKLEMGVSKPRPAALIDLASFFQISVEELLAGKRNEKPADIPFDYSAQEIRLRAEEYNRNRRKKKTALFAFLLITIVSFVLVIIIVECGMEDTALGPIVATTSMFADFGAILLFFVFYAAQKHQKRTLYTLFPEQAKEIRQLLTAGKKTVPSGGRFSKKWPMFYGFFSTIVLSLSISNITRQLTDDFLSAIIALVASELVLGSVYSVILRFTKKHKTRQNENDQTKM